MRRLKVLIAATLVWGSFLAVGLAGELWNAIPTSVLTSAEPRPLTDAEVFLGVQSDEGFVVRKPRWARIFFAAVAPGAIGLVALAAFAWVGGPIDPAVKPLRPNAYGSAVRSKTLVRVAIQSLRFVRAIFYIAAIWQAIGLLPLLGWLSNPDGISGGMLALLAIKVAALALFSLIVWALRRLIERLRTIDGSGTEAESSSVPVKAENRP